MKVAINKCFGGFHLSPLAIKRLAELRGQPCYFFQTRIEGRKMVRRPVDLATATKDDMFVAAYTVADPEAYAGTHDNWAEMSLEERTAYNAKWNEISLDAGRKLTRHDPLLVQVVEELGPKASARVAQIEIVEIPDGVDYVVDEYDGLESIHEAHRSWS